MTPQEHIHQLLCEVGPALRARQVTAGPDADFWQVVLGDHTVFDLEYDAALQRVVLASRLGDMPLEQTVQARLAVCELLLHINFEWRETGGVRMALDARSSAVVMLFEMPAAVLDLPLLTNVLRNLADKHRHWRELLAGT